MLKLSKFPMILVYIVGILIIFSASLWILGSYSYKSIHTLGKYSIDVYSQNIKKNTSELILESTAQISKHYSSILSSAQYFTMIMADLTAHFTDGIGYYNKPDNGTENLLDLFKLNEYYLSQPTNDTTLFYWGSEKQDYQYSSKNTIDAVSYLSKPMSGIKLIFPYADEIWVAIADKKYFISNPGITKSSDKLTYISNLKKYFQEENEYYSSYYNNNKIKVIEPIWSMRKGNALFDNEDLSVKYPIFNSKGKFAGFTGIDINLQAMMKEVSAENSTLSIYDKNAINDTILLTNDYTIVAMSKKIAHMFNISSKTDTTNRVFDPEFNTKLTNINSALADKVITAIKKNNSGMLEITYEGETFFMAFSKIEANNWIVITVLPLKEILDPIYLTNKKTVSLMESLSDNYILISIIFLACIALISGFFFWALILSPVNTLRHVVKKIGKGEFKTEFNTNGIKEIYELASGIKVLGNELTDFTENLQKETAHRQSLETEIQIAAEIQQSVLPKITKEFIRNEFEFYCKLIPAKEASGDFFDFFYVEEDLLAIVIADVSGKGIPAAFFMNMAKVVIKNIAMTKYKNGPGEVLKLANKTLHENNDTFMFVTMYLYFYNVKTGNLKYANAGHHNTLKLKKCGAIETFGEFDDPALALFDDIIFNESEISLEINESIVAYTDGLSEAPDNNVMFGDEKIINHFLNKNNVALQDLCDQITDSVLEYQHNSRFDDITIVALRRKS